MSCTRPGQRLAAVRTGEPCPQALTGTRIASARGPSGIEFTSEVPIGTYHVTVTGSRAHYDLTVTSNQLP